MQGTILVYGNESMLVATRGLILEKAGYTVFMADEFSNAMLALMHHQIDVLVLCQSLKDEERRGILETANALHPNIKCADLGRDEILADGNQIARPLAGPTALLTAIGRILHNEDTSQTSVSN